MSVLPLDTETAIYDCLIFQLCRELACNTKRKRDLIVKLVGHINKSKKLAQRLDELMNEVYSLDETLRETHRDNCSLAEMLQHKPGEKDSLTKTLREKLAELKKALTDCVELIESNRDLHSEIFRIRSELRWRTRKIPSFRNVSSDDNEKLRSRSWR